MVTGQTAKRWKTSLGWITIVDSLCKGCGFCIEFCPLNALEESQEFNQHGYHFPEMVDPEACVNCEYCQLVCPDFAIWSETKEEHPD